MFRFNVCRCGGFAPPQEPSRPKLRTGDQSGIAGGGASSKLEKYQLGLNAASHKSRCTPVKSLRKPGVRVSERRNKSSESKESDLAMAEGELAFQLARLPEEVAIFAAESRLAVLLGTYGADIAGAIRGLAKLPALPERLRPEAPRTGMAKRHQ
jgi:hypothetical protein